MNDAREEYLAAKTAAAAFDLTGRAQLELTGRDRVKFLHNFCTNDIKRLQAGEGCEAFITNVKGRVLGHVFVFAGIESLWLDSVPGADEPLAAHLERYIITEDVTIKLRTEECGELLISGPRAAEALAKFKLDFDKLPLYGHIASPGPGPLPSSVRRVDWLGAPGYLLLARREALPMVQSMLDWFSAGVVSASGETFDALRIESGFPLYGRDITDENIAQEVGRTSRAISFTKGCYLGQEPIARLDALGHVNRQLCTLKLAAGPMPEAGAVLLAEGEETEVGRVTSAVVSPGDGLPVALAYVRSKYAAGGSRLAVQVGDERTPATVVELG